MLQAQLIKLKDWILQYNPYFDTAFSNVTQDSETGIINDTKQPVFPADNFGNYFYLRLPNNIVFDYSQPSIGDNQLSVGIKTPVFLICCMVNADADELILNMLATIGRYQDVNMRFVNATYQKEVVLMQELAKLDKNNISSALQRMPSNLTIVSIQFTISFPVSFPKLNCLTKPCSTC